MATSVIGAVAVVGCVVTALVLDSQDPSGLSAPTGDGGLHGGDGSGGGKDPSVGQDDDGGEAGGGYRSDFPTPQGATPFTPDRTMPDTDYFRLDGDRDTVAAVKDDIAQDLADLGYRWDERAVVHAGPEPLTDIGWNGQVYSGDDFAGSLRVELIEDHLGSEPSYIKIEVGYP